MRRKNLKFVIGGIILILAIIYLVYTGIQKAGVYYLTVSELKNGGSSSQGEVVKVNGKVTDGTIKWDGQSLNFIITDGKQDLQVRYRGVAPDTFKNGTEVVVRGLWEPGSIFQADKIMAKCPSKYEAE